MRKKDKKAVPVKEGGSVAVKGGSSIKRKRKGGLARPRFGRPRPRSPSHGGEGGCTAQGTRVTAGQRARRMGVVAMKG